MKKKNLSNMLIMILIILFMINSSPLCISQIPTSTLASHQIYGIAQYSDGVLASGGKVEVVSTYGVVSDWIDANGEWSVNVGDPGPNWPEETPFTVYGIGCCEHDGWTGEISGIIFGEENNMGMVIIGPNQPPQTPSTPQGPQHILRGISGAYTTFSTDPNYKHNIEYRFDWDSEGTHNYSQFSNTTPSGTEVSMIHTWDIPGSYVIKTLARDDYGLKSAWSEGLLVTVYASNTAPGQPDITGTTEGKTDQIYNFDINCEDPEGHDLYYSIDWGDGTIDEWIGPYASNQQIVVTHAWADIGTYTITVKAKDIIGNESILSESHVISIIGPQLSIASVWAESGYIKAELLNNGLGDAENIFWTLSLEGGWVGPSRQMEGTVLFLEGMNGVTIRSDQLFGFGLNINIFLTITCDQQDPLYWEGSALIFFRYIMLT